jgi:prostaglandin-endoperoxide synthase 2
MTVEFSLLYRWHGLVMENVTWGDKAHPGNSLLLNNSLLIGSGLAQSFVNTSANRTAMLGLENAASFMMFAETGAINQARINNVTSYNDYRLAMGMEPARNFAAIVGSSDTPAEQARLSALAKRLEGLYGDVNNVEYYIGLFAERVEKNGPLPELVSSMVAMDAFSQALTNPLLSEHVWGNPANKRLAFTEDGIKVIEQTKRLRDIVDRNAKGLGKALVGMTRPEWKRT